MSASESGTYQLPVSIRRLADVDRSGHWLGQGWRDFLKAPGVSLVYGGAFVVVGLALTIGLVWAGLGSLILPLAGGLMIVAPILVVGPLRRRTAAGGGTAGVPRRLLQRVRPQRRATGGNGGRAAGVLSVLGALGDAVVRTLLQSGSAAVRPVPRRSRPVAAGAPLLLVGSIVGAAFAATVFSITAISIPLIYDRPVDALTSIGVSLLTVRENFKVMFGWAALIVLVTAFGHRHRIHRPCRCPAGSGLCHLACLPGSDRRPGQYIPKTPPPCRLPEAAPPTLSAERPTLSERGYRDDAGCRIARRRLWSDIRLWLETGCHGERPSFVGVPLAGIDLRGSRLSRSRSAGRRPHRRRSHRCRTRRRRSRGCRSAGGVAHPRQFTPLPVGRLPACATFAASPRRRFRTPIFRARPD